MVVEQSNSWSLEDNSTRPVKVMPEKYKKLASEHIMTGCLRLPTLILQKVTESFVSHCRAT